MISCYGGAFEAVKYKNWWCVQEVQGVNWCVSWGVVFIFEATGEDLSVLC